MPGNLGIPGMLGIFQPFPPPEAVSGLLAIVPIPPSLVLPLRMLLLLTLIVMVMAVLIPGMLGMLPMAAVRPGIMSNIFALTFSGVSGVSALPVVTPGAFGTAPCPLPAVGADTFSSYSPSTLDGSALTTLRFFCKSSKPLAPPGFAARPPSGLLQWPELAEESSKVAANRMPTRLVERRRDTGAMFCRFLLWRNTSTSGCLARPYRS
mmetsp:Transcript_100668/g.181661  ORF Transcript_100668/g.181661 Transcript_100668/m.181661 type:complete len:208 (-) Transcript_100668:24-647(-)